MFVLGRRWGEALLVEHVCVRVATINVDEQWTKLTILSPLQIRWTAEPILLDGTRNVPFSGEARHSWDIRLQVGQRIMVQKARDTRITFLVSALEIQTRCYESREQRHESYSFVRLGITSAPDIPIARWELFVPRPR